MVIYINHFPSLFYRFSPVMNYLMWIIMILVLFKCTSYFINC